LTIHTGTKRDRDAAQQLAYLFHDSEKPPVFLLGAGASFRAGVPVAADAVRWIAQEAFKRKAQAGRVLSSPKPSEWLPWLNNQPWFRSDIELAENFPEAVEHLLRPAEFRREMLHALVQARSGVNEGYKRLARLMQRGLCRTVLTTNFDRLIHGALHELEPYVRHVVEVNQVPGDIAQFSVLRRYQIVYLHGSVEHYQDKNTRAETQEFNERLAGRLGALIDANPLIVIGYRGAEQSIMNGLLGRIQEDTGNFRNGVYWGARGEEALHPNVLALQRQIGGNFFEIRIDGFDGLLTELDLILSDVDHFGAGAARDPSDPQVAAFDERPLPHLSFDDFDRDLILDKLSLYSQRIGRGAVTPENCKDLMLEQALLAQVDGNLVPTIGGLLVFGKEPQAELPHACVRVTVGNRQHVFQGNLLTQFREIVELLNAAEINPTLRVKSPTSSSDRSAYPARVLTETVVNLLVHRDYAIEHYAEIDVQPGRHIRFANPGGLPKQVHDRVTPDAQGCFQPLRNVTQIRNACVADVFYGIGSMDREGSGLPDVLDISRTNGGDARFFIERNNAGFVAEILQPFQAAPGASSVARPLTPAGIYISNHLPFRVLPEYVYVLPSNRRPAEEMPLFFEDERPKELPIFAGRPGDALVSFADLSAFADFSGRRGDLRELRKLRTGDYAGDETGHRNISWLLRKHWVHYLRSLSREALIIENNRAYFTGSGEANSTLKYDSPKRRGIKRDVVKRREVGGRVHNENEGFWFSVIRFDDQWVLEIKPTYVFTKADGRTPLPSFLTSRLATRRFRFDRNKNVDDDLTFWARFIGQGKAAVGLPAPGAPDIVMAMEYLTFEVIEPETASEHQDRNSA